MTIPQYEKWVKSTKKKYNTKEYSVIALNEEAGEVAGFWKKYRLQGNPEKGFTKKDLALELGDVLKHLTFLALFNGWSLKTIMQMSVQKHKEELEDKEKDNE